MSLGSEIANGEFCARCLMPFVKAHGHPVVCRDCWPDHGPYEQRATHRLITAAWDLIDEIDRLHADRDLAPELQLSINAALTERCNALESRLEALERLIADSECTVCHTLFLTPDESNEHTEATGHACRRTR